MLLIPAVLGQRHSERTTGERYESGLPPGRRPAARATRSSSTWWRCCSSCSTSSRPSSSPGPSWRATPRLDRLHRGRSCSSCCCSRRSAYLWATRRPGVGHERAPQAAARERRREAARRARAVADRGGAASAYWAGRDGRAGGPARLRRAAGLDRLGPHATRSGPSTSACRAASSRWPRRSRRATTSPASAPRCCARRRARPT